MSTSDFKHPPTPPAIPTPAHLTTASVLNEDTK